MVTATSSPAAGSRRDHRPLLAASAVAAVGVAVVIGLTVTSTSSHRNAYPGARDDSTLTGTVAAPALQSQGLAVKVMLPHGSVLATVTGPETPGQGLPFQQTFDTTTWSLRFTAATTPVPLRLSNFDTLDHGGVVGHPYVVPGTPTPPAVLEPGHTVTFQLRETMAVGEGLFRYAPNGTNIEAKWDFEVEND